MNWELSCFQEAWTLDTGDTRGLGPRGSLFLIQSFVQDSSYRTPFSAGVHWCRALATELWVPLFTHADPASGTLHCL